MARTTKKPCRRCWVPSCRNSKPKEAAKKKLFLFPRDVTRCREWVKAIGDASLAETEMKKLNTIRFVCEDHFPPSKITPAVRPAADAVPVLFSPRRTPLSDSDLRAFDVQLRDEEDREQQESPHDTVHVDKITDITSSIINQDSCLSFASSELSHCSSEQTHVLGRTCAASSPDDILEVTEEFRDPDDPWPEFPLESFASNDVAYDTIETDSGSATWSDASEIKAEGDRCWHVDCYNPLPGLFPQLTEVIIPDSLEEAFRC